MLQRLSEAAAAWARRWVPDPFVLAALLTALVFALGLAVAPGAPAERLGLLLGTWGGKQGVWAAPLLEFTVQILLVLVSGHALAATPAARRVIDALAARPATPAGAAALVALVATTTALVNWGLSLIVGALVARAVGVSARARGVRVHYPLVVAAGYAGLAVWHGGLSASAPLKVTRAADVAAFLGDPATVAAVGSLVAARGGPGDGSIPTTLTLGAPLNLAVTGLLWLGIPALVALMAPRRPEACVEVDERVARAAAAEAPDPEAPGPDGPVEGATPAARLERSRLPALSVVGLGVAHLVGRVVAPSAAAPALSLATLDLDTLNLAFLCLGLLLHGSLASYARAVTAAMPGAAGVLVQFPLYFGVLAVMRASGLARLVADGIADAAGGSAGAFLVLTWLSASLINLFIPSGGGQWAVQGPIVLAGAARAGVDPGAAVLAFAYGDQWTNLLQPFWALPLLGLCGVRAGDIMGYTIVLWALTGPLIAVPLLLAG